MIFLHLIIGLILGKLTNQQLLFVIASILPDIDHIYILIKYKLFTKNKIIDALKNEKKYKIRFKTPLIHSILGLLICTLIYYLTFNTNTIYFASAYFIHLLLDWPDIDKKQFLYPLKYEFSGFLPIWSKTEKIITVISIIILVILFLY
ncbi:MAG: metal-dependent hydrolase [Nanoarchaeota archaeon]